MAVLVLSAARTVSWRILVPPAVGVIIAAAAAAAAAVVVVVAVLLMMAVLVPPRTPIVREVSLCVHR